MREMVGIYELGSVTYLRAMREMVGTIPCIVARCPKYYGL